MPVARFNLALDLWQEYNLAQVFDQGIQRTEWTSHRLKRDVLLLETARERYELVRVCNALVHGKTRLRASVQDTFELYRVLDARAMDDRALAQLPRPLPMERKVLVVSNLDWSEVLWGESCVRVRDVLLDVVCMCFVPRTAQGNAQQASHVMHAPANASAATSSSRNKGGTRHVKMCGPSSMSTTSRDVPLPCESSCTAAAPAKVAGKKEQPRSTSLKSIVARSDVSRGLKVGRGEIPLFRGPLSLELQSS
jgi:hypothetical protein